MSADPSPPPEIGSAAAHSTLALVGVKWVGVGALLQRAFQMASTIVLARLLVPEDFGAFAVASVLVDTLNSLKEMGMPSALIRLRGDVERAANAFFHVSVASSAVVFGATWVAAPQVAALVGSPLVAAVLRAMALKMVLESASIVQRTLTARELSLGRLTKVAIVEATVSASLAIVLAASGLGVWSLVLGVLGGSAASAILWSRISAWRPSRHPSLTVARQMIGFGANISGAWVVESATDVVTRALVGRAQGVVGLGYHDLALRMAVLPIRSLTMAVGQQVAVPALCLVQRDLRQVASWYLAVVRGLSAATAPLAVCLVALADLVVIGVCGQQWARAVPLVTRLAPCLFIVPLVYAPRPVYIATGRVDLLMKLSLLQMVLTVPAVSIAARVGLEAVCAVQVAVLAVVAAVSLFLTRRQLHLRWDEVGRALGVPLEGIAVQALVLLSLRAWLHPEPTVTALAVVATPALLAYAVVMRLRQPELVKALLAAARRASGLAAAS